MTGARCAVVHEVKVTNYQRQRMVELIDHVRTSSALELYRLLSIGHHPIEYCFIFLLITNHLFLLPFKPSACQKVLVNVNDLTEPSGNASAKPTQALKLKVQRGNVTRSQDRPTSGMRSDRITMMVHNYLQYMLRPRHQKLLCPSHQ
jgi:hypothetical protein